MTIDSNIISKLKILVERFERLEHEITVSSSDYNETEARNDFINEFFRILGWDVLNEKGLPKPLREVLLEANVNVRDQGRKPDYEFRFNGTRKFFVEAKKPSVDILTSHDSAFQTRSYGWSAQLPISVLTNFKDLIIYDCLPIPDENDNSRVAVIKHYSYKEYVTKFDEIYEQLSKDSINRGTFDELFSIPAEDRRGEKLFDEYFLEQIEKWRLLLATDILKHNPKLNEESLNYLIQAFINRIVFLRICEDRNLETYGTLKNLDKDEAIKKLLELFLEADKRYDSGLFNFIRDKLSPSIVISGETLMEIVNDLYYPQSPYNFSVIDTKLLGDIYEHFIASKIVIREQNIPELEVKPEVKAANGVYTTPTFIVRHIVSESLKDISESNINNKRASKIADIACGSGVFLVETYQYLLDLLLKEYIAKNKLEFLRKDDSGDYLLKLEERKRILLDQIYGVDIDEQAVEVAKFSLLLKVIEDVPKGEIDVNLSRGEKALPLLEENIKCGNSLVSNEYYDYKSHGQVNDTEIHQIKPFDWKSEFPKIFNSEKGFSVIVGNPPYTKIQNIVHYSPIESEFYKSHYSPYVSSKANNFDKYQLFIERGVSLLKSDGVLGFIVPHKFTTIRAGEPIRELISSNKYLKEYTNFGTLQIFGNKSTTYTCIILLKKSKLDKFDFEKVDNISQWEKSPTQNKISYSSDVITKEPWILVSKQEKELLDRLEQQANKRLGDNNISEIFVGLQTSADDIYIFNPIRISENEVEFKDKEGKQWTIERSICKEAILDQSIHYFENLRSNRLLIFPYKEVNGQNVIIPEVELKEKYPKTYEYLYAFREKLERRDLGSPYTLWYQFGRSQSLNRFNTPKAIIKNPSLFACAVYDDKNIMFTGGGNGPYYGIRPQNDFSIYVLLAFINSSLFDKWVKSRSSVFRGGYYSFGKQFIANFPLPDLDDAEKSRTLEEIEVLWKKLIALNNESSFNTPQRQDEVQREKDVLKKESDKKVASLYDIVIEESSAEEYENNTGN